jgi:hypothetical protein
MLGIDKLQRELTVNIDDTPGPCQDGTLPVESCEAGLVLCGVTPSGLLYEPCVPPLLLLLPLP